jgi:mRNA-degrading endonuclease RelE of RelBE toxin-antitoxin system
MSYKIKTTKRFKKELKELAKRYKKIKYDYKNLLDKLEKNPRVGIPLGDNCYKIRLPNSSIPTGKSGGFRVVTYVKLEDRIILLTIYSKKDKDNISKEEINAILQNIKENNE